MTTYYTDPANEAAALALCGRSETKRNLLDGSQNWSLSDLAGKAKKFGGSYARARDELLRDLRAAGLDPLDIKLPSQKGKRVVII